jgi:phosphoribosylaminoimidazolecarboxamide formyltransferase/IMP cyclohydrolase
MDQMREHGVSMIDLVVVNLYPFKKTIEKPDCTLAGAIEQIDIGGPAMLRSAAKNYRYVTVVVNPSDYEGVLYFFERGESAPSDFNLKLSLKAFEHTAAYDALIASYLGGIAYGKPGNYSDSANRGVDDGAAVVDKNAAVVDIGAAIADTPGGDSDIRAEAVATLGGASRGEADASSIHYFPDSMTLTYVKKQMMRYGENPHQAAAFYSDPIPSKGSLATYTQLHGKDLSYNNIGDLDGALSLAAEFREPAVVAVKHANPCGAAVADNLYDAYVRAYESDKMSIFGGVIAANRTIDAKTAAEISKIFIEIVAAPGFDDDALKILTKKRNIRLLAIEPARETGAERSGLFIKKVGGGLLAQSYDNLTVDMDKIVFATKKVPTEKEMEDLRFAMTVVKHTKSNAIVLAKDMATVGVGPGQNSRIVAAKIAIELAGMRAMSSVAASEALFPFDDCVEAFAAAGVAAVIQPGGGKNDSASIDACDRHGIAMVLTGVRHFLH